MLQPAPRRAPTREHGSSCASRARWPAPDQRGFTLLEVIIALAILSVGLMVLVDSQASALMVSNESDNILTATMLAEEKMAEVQLMVEQEGFREQEVEEQGDFEDFGNEEFRGDALRLDLEDELQDFRWAYTVREVEFQMPDLGDTASQLVDGGYFGDEENTENFDVGGAPDLGDFMSTDMITDMLSGYIREVRVLVWWGDNEDETDQIELTTHVINPSGTVVPGAYGEVPDESQ